MDWIKNFVEGLGSAEEKRDASTLIAAFEKGEVEAHKFMQRLVELGKPMVAEGNSMEASVLMFVAILRAVGTAKSAVDASVKMHGESSPVKKMWDLLGPVLTCGSEEEALAMLDAFKKKTP